MKRAVSALGLAVLATACLESSVNGPPQVATIQLTAAQAAAINSSIQSIAITTPELSSLADSANLVLKAGAVVDSAAIDVNFGGEPFYAVSLQRAVTQTVHPFSTFEIIYFNNPSAPTRFVIVSVYARGTGGPPDGAFANIAFPTEVLTANVHFYAIESGAVTHWRATAGSVQLGNGLPGGACPDYTGPGNCERADLLIGGSVTATIRESGSAAGSPIMSIVNGFVRGIRLKFTII
jgi:hypothetical protein